MLVDADELKRFGELRLQLRVNGEVRQNMVVEGDILYPPVQALQALSKFQKLDAGDIVLTGTPVGTALTAHGVTPKGDIDLGAFLTAQVREEPRRTCTTVTWSRPPWPPTTAPSTSAPSAMWWCTNERADERHASLPEFVPVVIVGAGPAGIAAATLLGQYGVETLVLDRHETVYPLPRAVHADDEVYRILARLGIGDEFAAHRRSGARSSADRPAACGC